jgi:hypothetical protein
MDRATKDAIEDALDRAAALFNGQTMTAAVMPCCSPLPFFAARLSAAAHTWMVGHRSRFIAPAATSWPHSCDRLPV